jgi:GntR family transcriptional regulator
MALVPGPPLVRGKELGLTRLSQAVGSLGESSNLPLYQQLQRALREAIDRGILGADDALPPERDLATEFGVSRITVRKAIDGLVSEGLLVRRHGSGTFVRGRVEKNFSMLTSFSEDMRARGRNPRSDWLKRSSGTVTPEEALTLRSSPGTPVFRFHRLRFADDAPMSIEYATIVATCLPSLDAVESSLYEALERSGNRPVRALQRLRAVLLTREQAELLRANPSDAGLLVERLGFLDSGQAVEFSQSYYRGDTYDFVAELSTSP